MDWIFSLVTLAALALVLGALALWRRGGARRQVWLMLLLAAVMIANLLVWAVPLPESAG
ncbi:MAG: hypothetical protein H5U21_05735 [Porphyrobacter sp.]|nr:hypothetical protein [Porphyrobacter sp.]